MSASPAKPPNAAAQRVEGFLLTRDWRDTDDGVELELWAASNQGPLRIIVTGQDAVCFLPRDVAVPSDMVDDISVRFERRPVELTSPDGRPVDALYVHGQRALQSVRERAIARGMALFEADLKPTDRYLMERFITGGIELEGRPIIRPGYREFRNPRLRASHHQPTLSVVSLDIETSDLEGQLYSIALSSERDERVLMVGDSSPPSGDLTIEYYPTEVDVLQALFDWMHRFDPDIIIGWNVIGFDLHFLNQRCQSLGLTFSLGRNKRRANIHLPRGPNQVPLAVVGGRAVLDGIECLRAAFWTFEDYSLQAVSESLLGIGKTIVDHNRVDEIRRLYAEDPVGLARYNLQDCRLVREIFDATDLLHFYVERSQLTGLALGRIGGSVSAFDNLYLPRLHRRGFVAPDTVRFS
ncbi:MAG: 3'-5' exonuclease [Pseudomonadota bacterium]